MIIGGSASGKSEFAERYVCSLDGSRIYIAAMEPFGEEAMARIERHHQMRRYRGFETIERYTDLKNTEVPYGANILLEDLGNLTANEMYSEKGEGSGAVLDGIHALLAVCSHLTVVTNEVFSGGCDYEGDTLNYMLELARLNRKLAAEADRVCEIVCGLPVWLKDEQTHTVTAE